MYLLSPQGRIPAFSGGVFLFSFITPPLQWQKTSRHHF